MWPFKKKIDEPEPAKPESNPGEFKPNIQKGIIFNVEATKKLIEDKKTQEDKKDKSISISRTNVDISSKLKSNVPIQSFLEINGYFEQTENGDYILGWANSYTENNKTVSGKFVLLKKNVILLQGKMLRANEGKVAANGTFILSDWSAKTEYGGTFYAIRADGTILVQLKVKANLANTDISDDGNYAVCQTWNSPISPEDSNKLFFFDLSKPILVWSCEPEPGNADSFQFDIGNRILFLENNNGGKYRYNFDGLFLDAEKLEKVKLEKLLEKKKGNEYSSNGYELFDYAKEIKEKLDASKAESSCYDKVISLMKKSLEIGVSEYTQSLIHRDIGEIYLKQNNTSETINHFEKAISLNPKIGIKKILTKLKNPEVK